jgi:hypothetical protein
MLNSAAVVELPGDKISYVSVSVQHALTTKDTASRRRRRRRRMMMRRRKTGLVVPRVV